MPTHTADNNSRSMHNNADDHATVSTDDTVHVIDSSYHTTHMRDITQMTLFCEQ